MKKFLIMLAAAALGTSAAAAAPKELQLSSPDGTVTVKLSHNGEKLHWALDIDSKAAVAPTPIALTLDDGTLWSGSPQQARITRSSVNSSFETPFYIKSRVQDNYNQLRLDFRNEGYALELRVYNDGAAYRFISRRNTPVTIRNEEAGMNFDGNPLCRVPYVRDCDGQDIVPFGSQFKTSFENLYTVAPLSELDPQKLAFLPLTAEIHGLQLLFTESDLQAYPAMYLHNPDGGNALHAVFPPYPRSVTDGGYNNLQGIVREYEDYIARVAPQTAMPWRTLLIARNDAELLANDMVMRLAEPSRIDDTSWIRAGKAAWEWWNDWGLTGVDFTAGVNNDTYKHYIDFAHRNNLEYLVIDDGWSKDHTDLLTGACDDLDLQALIDYAAQRNVGIILWAGYRPFERNLEEVCRRYSQMGVKGFKVDFMDRADQIIAEFLYSAAETAARYHLLLDYHGIYKPAGLQRTWPNVMNFEGVHGLEQMKWSPESVDQITYDVSMPFIRMAAGPVDYTQGAMLNDAPGLFNPRREEPSSQGTRCRQIAEYVLFHSPLSMMCDSPSLYDREAECTAFIAAVPTVWDETRPIEGKIGESAVVARRKDNVWYVGGLCGHEPKEFLIDLGFLGENAFEAELFTDGANAAKHGSDYKRTSLTLDNNKKLAIKTAPGGGFAIRLTPKESAK